MVVSHELAHQWFGKKTLGLPYDPEGIEGSLHLPLTFPLFLSKKEKKTLFSYYYFLSFIFSRVK